MSENNNMCFYSRPFKTNGCKIPVLYAPVKLGYNINTKLDLCRFCVKEFKKNVSRNAPFKMIPICHSADFLVSRNDLYNIADYLILFGSKRVGFLKISYGFHNLNAAQKDFKNMILKCGHKWAHIKTADDFVTTMHQWHIF